MTRVTGGQGLQALGLGKRYRDVEAVADMSLLLRPGEIVSLMGPNGSGKSTVYRMLTGSVRPDRGRIEIDSIDITHLPSYARARCGLSHLPQEPSAFRGLSVADNVRLALETQEPNADTRQVRLTRIITEMGLDEVKDHKSTRISGGERRRCEIARLLAGDPRYLLLDEPFAGVDPLAIAQFKQVIVDLSKRGIGILITDHNIRDTLDISDRTIVIAQGHVLADSEPSRILADPHLKGLWLGPDFRV